MLRFLAVIVNDQLNSEFWPVKTSSNANTSIYPKGKKGTTDRAAKPPKRRFHGNRFLNKEEDVIGQSSTAKKIS